MFINNQLLHYDTFEDEESLASFTLRLVILLLNFFDFYYGNVMTDLSYLLLSRSARMNGLENFKKNFYKEIIIC